MAGQRKYFIWGMGLLGTSLGLALKRQGHIVRGCVRSSASKDILSKMNFDQVYLSSDNSLWEALIDSHGVIIGTPIEHVFEIIDLIKQRRIPEHIWITDMASTKADLMSWVDQQDDPPLFIGSHPMAGSDLDGPANGDADLFHNATVYITLSQKLDTKAYHKRYKQSLEELLQMWAETGALTHEVPYEVHDQWAAYLSHGLHLVSCMVSHMIKDIPEVFDVPSNPAGGSFRDITRVAGSNPALWNGIIGSNSKEVKKYLENLEILVKDWIFAFEKGVLPIDEVFEQAGEIRRRIIDK